jgi:hypothetical protein
MWWKKEKLDIKVLKSIDISPFGERKQYNIIIIDDQIFPLLDSLRKHGFTISKFNDIEDIDELKGFDIIICDIRGIGQTFQSRYQGAHIVKEIHKRFPNKYLIVYSGSTFSVEYNNYFKLSDKTVKKGTDLSEWVVILDTAIKDFINPYKQWEKTRAFLQENEIDTKTLLKFEQAYIKSILRKDDRFFRNALQGNKRVMSNEYLSFSLNTLSNFISSVVSNMLMMN